MYDNRDECWEYFCCRQCILQWSLECPANPLKVLQVPQPSLYIRTSHEQLTIISLQAFMPDFFFFNLINNPTSTLLPFIHACAIFKFYPCFFFFLIRNLTGILHGGDTRDSLSCISLNRRPKKTVSRSPWTMWYRPCRVCPCRPRKNET